MASNLYCVTYHDISCTESLVLQKKGKCKIRQTKQKKTDKTKNHALQATTKKKDIYAVLGAWSSSKLQIKYISIHW